MLTKEEELMLEQARKQIETANLQTQQLANQTPTLPIHFIKHCKGFDKLVYSGNDWCILSNGKRAVVVEKIQAPYDFGTDIRCFALEETAKVYAEEDTAEYKKFEKDFYKKE